MKRTTAFVLAGAVAVAVAASDFRRLRTGAATLRTLAVNALKLMR